MDFFKLTTEEILHGLNIMHDTEYADECLNRGDPLICFLYDTELQTLAFKWLDNNQDIVLTKLTN